MSENHNCGLFAWLFKYCRCCAMLIPLAPVLHSGPYLALVGPPPLRFESPIQYENNFTGMPKPEPAPVIIAETNATVVTATTSNTNSVSALSGTSQSPASTTSSPENLSTNAIAPASSANDLLVVTPEMLVDYFKQNGGSTNSNNVRVAAPVDFTPPPPASNPSSQAIYQSQ
ncbi:MAG: hypothetical protein ACLQSR_17135 [Limisphaerales bacterium]